MLKPAFSIHDIDMGNINTDIISGARAPDESFHLITSEASYQTAISYAAHMSCLLSRTRAAVLGLQEFGNSQMTLDLESDSANFLLKHEESPFLQFESGHVARADLDRILRAM